MSVISKLLNELRDELEAAQIKHPPMNSLHEGYAVILEELDELWDEIKDQHGAWGLRRKEALQVAAMALRFIYDLQPAPDPIATLDDEIPF